VTVCVFTGPTLAPRDGRAALDAVWLPPAKRGDVYRAAALLRPQAIGIVDGYFQWTPSVHHKEILWAIGQGVHVFGAASMGALRAAELAPFGMRGVGRIFDAYRTGALRECGDESFEDDDEVAVVHGPPESGYVAASEAMVNIRCTLAAAERAGVIAGDIRAQLVAVAKAMHFPERSYEALLRRARAAALPGPALADLEAWLPDGRVNQKRADALAMLETMKDFLARDPAPAEPRFTFEHTTLWEGAFTGLEPATVHDEEETRVLDELRLEAARWNALLAEALRSVMAPAGGEHGTPRTPLPQRLAGCGADPAAIERELDEEARSHAARRLREALPPAIVERRMLALLRGTEDYERLRERAEDKRLRLAARRDLPDAGEFSELQLLGLRDWYFSRVLGEDMPDDLAWRVGASGYADLEQFHRALFDEYVYRQMTGAADGNAGGGQAGSLRR
jgi:hypothetical protein